MTLVPLLAPQFQQALYRLGGMHSQDRGMTRNICPTALTCMANSAAVCPTCWKEASPVVKVVQKSHGFHRTEAWTLQQAIGRPVHD